MFGNVPGLLSPEMEQAQRDASIWGLAGGLLNASRWSTTPINFGQALGEGLEGAQKGSQIAGQQNIQNTVLKLKMDEAAQEKARQAAWLQVISGQGPLGSQISEPMRAILSSVGPEKGAALLAQSMEKQKPQLATVKNQYGDDVSVWADPSNQQVTPIAAPTVTGSPAQAESAIPPPPPGSDAKAWRTDQTKRLADNREALPGAIAAAQESLKLIDQIKKDPYLSRTTGGEDIIPAFPGSPVRSLKIKIEQLKGKNFLVAYQHLKGGGAITQIEGIKAENAIARLDTAQTDEDFVTALNDLEEVIKSGVERASAKAGTTSPSSANTAAPDPLGLR